MEKIGVILKERRLELGLSLEEMSKKTKLSTVQLKAIEEGNIEFFRDDLSYLTYFVRYYANALHLDFDELRSELDNSILAYTNTMSISKVKEQEEITNNVLNRSSKGPRARARKKIDLKSFSLVVAALLVVLLLGTTFIKVILPALKSEGPIKPPVVVAPDDKDKPDDKDDENKPGEKPTEKPVEKPEEKPEETKELIITPVSDLHYEVSGWQAEDSLTFDFEFNNRAWVRFSENDVVLDNPAQGTYESGDKAKVILKAEADKTLSFNVGYMNGNKIYLNEKEVPLTEADKNSVSGMVIEFKLVEGATE